MSPNSEGTRIGVFFQPRNPPPDDEFIQLDKKLEGGWMATDSLLSNVQKLAENGLSSSNVVPKCHFFSIDWVIFCSFKFF